MANYKTDLRDINFNLFELLKVEKYSSDMEVNDLKDLISQFDNFVEKEIFSCREQGDHEGVRMTPEGVKVPESFIRANETFYENGWFALGVKEDLGGMPMPEAITTTCTGLFTGANVSYSMYPGLTKSAFNCIVEVGNETQKSFYLPPMLEGRWGGTMCLTEAGAGSDVGNLRTTAEPLENGKYKIKGTKIFISSGESDLYENNIHLVLARTPDGEKGTKGISLFVVPRYKINEDGSKGESNDVVCSKTEEKMGLHGQATCVLEFGSNDDCIGELIGEKFMGMPNMFVMMNEARLLCGVQGEAQANLCYQLTIDYAKERAQFETEIINHPDVKRQLLKMRAMCRGMRATVLYTANLFDQERAEKGSAINEINLLTPVCKAYCSDEGFQVAVDAMQVHGGYGYCSEYGIEQFARDIKIASIYEGTNGIQAIDFIGRKILKDQGKTFLAVGAKISNTLKTDEAKQFADERRLIIDNQKISEEILQKFAKKAAEGKMEDIFEHATDFLSFCGNIMVAWRLLESACLANKMLAANPNEEEKFYLESKLIDFQVFCQHYLTRNFAISRRILNFEQNMTNSPM